MQDFKNLRELMLDNQLKLRGIKDPSVLQAMGEVPRQEFVPEHMAKYAYEDSPLPIGEGQTISQPYIVAFMTELLELSFKERVLEIGTGSGYGAAVLSRIAHEVFTIERYEDLADAARQRFRRLGYNNIRIFHGDGSLGLEKHSSYHAIVVTAGAPSVPESLKEQLAVGGRLVIPVGSTKQSQQLIRVRRLSKHEYSQTTITPVRFVPLIGKDGWHSVSSHPIL